MTLHRVVRAQVESLIRLPVQITPPYRTTAFDHEHTEAGPNQHVGGHGPPHPASHNHDIVLTPTLVDVHLAFHVISFCRSEQSRSEEQGVQPDEAPDEAQAEEGGHRHSSDPRDGRQDVQRRQPDRGAGEEGEP